jgi:hypothetical protein
LKRTMVKLKQMCYMKILEGSAIRWIKVRHIFLLIKDVGRSPFYGLDNLM